MIVVFDSNIWLSQVGLRTPAAAAAKFFLNRQDACVVIPEVVRLEVQHNLQRTLGEYIATIRTNHDKLLAVFGRLKEIVLPEAAEVEAKVATLFESLEVRKEEIPFTLESARSSFLKTIDKVPPSAKDQQFKDGVLWADCMRLLASDSVVLVTADKAFYMDRQYEKGLARNLQVEVDRHSNRFRIMPGLSDLLQDIRTRIIIDEEQLALAFLEQHHSVLEPLDRHGFELARRHAVAYTLFATENPNALFIEFAIEYDCNDIRGEGRTDAILHLKGDGEYNPADNLFRDLRNFGERLSYRSADGAEKEHRSYVLHAGSLVIGHREVSSNIRYPLDSQDQ